MKVKRPTSSASVVFDVWKEGSFGLWYWRAWSRNGRIIADSAEGYHRKADAIRGCKLLQTHAATSAVFVNQVLVP